MCYFTNFLFSYSAIILDFGDRTSHRSIIIIYTFTFVDFGPSVIVLLTKTSENAAHSHVMPDIKAS